MELKQSKEILENIICKEVNSISYPFGRYNQHVIDESKKTRYHYGFTMKFPTENDSSLTIGRYPIYGFDNLFSIKQKIEHGKAKESDVDLLYDVACNIEGRTICALGEAGAWPVKGILKKFKDEFIEHARTGKCKFNK